MTAFHKKSHCRPLMKKLFNKKIKNVVIVFRDESILSVCRQVSKVLKEKGIRSQSFSQKTIASKILETAADLILVLGGDGTYLNAVRFAQNSKAPVLGINMGSLGFLTVHPRENLYKILNQALQGKLREDTRPLLEVSSGADKLSFQQGLALNDVVIERGVTSRLIDISVYLGNKWMYSLKSDGLIISSAAGSTAYNLAAGGPILYPKVEAFVVTPICPHSLTHRPVLFPDKETLKLKVENAAQGALLTIDGRKQCKLSKSSSVVIKKSKKVHKALKSIHHSDFIFLKDKLKFFERSG